MNRYSIIIVICLLSITEGIAQSNLQLGVGYFGETVSHPGVVLELTKEKVHSEKGAFVWGLNLGFYNHPRQHTGIFLDVQLGHRRYFSSGFFLEQRIGVGILQTILNGEDGVFIVDENNSVSETDGFNQPDLMPSLNFGIGWNITHQKEVKTLVWIRPKIFWQFPQKTKSVYHLALQIGMSRSL